MRVSLGPDPVSRRSHYRSLTVTGDLAEAERQRAALAAQAEQLRTACVRPLRTLAELLGAWLAAEHDWKPSTWHNYRLAADRLAKDPLAARPPTRLSPPVVTAAVRTWRTAGIPPSTMALHVRTLRAALGWAYEQRLIACQPMDGMRGLPQSEPRRDVPVAVVTELLGAAEDDLAHADGQRSRHAAEQLRLLLRLAAGTGARRGELAALRTDDLDGRRLRIERGLSDEVLTTTKTGRARTVTVATTTAELWHRTVDDWQGRQGNQPLGSWLFATDASHTTRLGAGRLAGQFRAFCRRHDPATSPCTGCGTPSPPSWSPTASCCRHSSASGTATLPPPCASTATPYRWPTRRLPTTSSSGTGGDERICRCGETRLRVSAVRTVGACGLLIELAEQRWSESRASPSVAMGVDTAL